MKRGIRPATTGACNPDSYRTEVLDAHLFNNLEEVREITWTWMIQYNEERPHESLGGIPPSQYRRNTQQPELTTATHPEPEKGSNPVAVDNSLTRNLYS